MRALLIRRAATEGLRPMMDDFDKLLDRMPELRTRRTLTADSLRKMFGRQKGECTWCGESLAKCGGTRWHQACCQQFFARCRVDGAARRVMVRDNGVCQVCGRSVTKCERIWKHYRGRQYGRDQYDTELILLLGYARGHWFEIDHIVPVCEGGGLCKLENLRLVCGVCHRNETSELARRRADRRKPKTEHQAELFPT